MDECYDWKFCRKIGIGIAIGGGIVLFVVYAPFLDWKETFLNRSAKGRKIEFFKSLHEDIVLILPAFNVLASACWYYGIERKKSICLIISLIYWLINMLLVAICIYSFLTAPNVDEATKDYFKRQPTIYIGIVWCVGSYIVAILCYRSMKKANLRNPAEMPLYAIPPKDMPGTYRDAE